MSRTVEIVGGGLAGLSLGVALRRRQVPVIIREASSYPRHKVCGEFVNGVQTQTLSRLGVEDLFRDSYQHFQTGWWVGNVPVLQTKLQRPALGLSRWQIDERLAQRFEELGGELFTGQRVALAAREGRVWTAGRKAEKGSPWLGLKAHFRGLTIEGLEMHLGANGYVGLTPVAEGVNVCALFRRLPNAGGDPWKSYLAASGLYGLSRRLQQAKMDPRSLTGVTGLLFGKSSLPHDLCVLGDAERMIPPFTGNGMSMAFEAAECAIDPLRAWSSADIEWDEARRKISRRLDEQFSKRVRLARWLHHLLMTEAGRASVGAAASSGLLPFQWLHRRLSGAA